mmetsp:Transcript_19799/g.47120  ORF Transcript_19799/g.47120 Transcript_19799/m.47120 type:complete len:102 (+) Transcript_19799:930-1235(+)
MSASISRRPYSPTRRTKEDPLNHSSKIILFSSSIGSIIYFKYNNVPRFEARLRCLTSYRPSLDIAAAAAEVTSSNRQNDHIFENEDTNSSKNAHSYQPTRS